ncbi:hypothetical protein F2P81_018732 [Scophthalmus maximus]|uniref:Uncharacterized protein n=1 Tax=Scophthalmus maximus TaxID=52904 RepID=A0A6A4S8Y8_SCOMX|nr:hypothetical protein F2P81_018732 [Scophthalmus maximus]
MSLGERFKKLTRPHRVQLRIIVSCDSGGLEREGRSRGVIRMTEGANPSQFDLSPVPPVLCAPITEQTCSLLRFNSLFCFATPNFTAVIHLNRRYACWELCKDLHREIATVDDERRDIEVKVARNEREIYALHHFLGIQFRDPQCVYAARVFFYAFSLKKPSDSELRLITPPLHIHLWLREKAAFFFLPYLVIGAPPVSSSLLMPYKHPYFVWDLYFLEMLFLQFRLIVAFAPCGDETMRLYCFQPYIK